MSARMYGAGSLKTGLRECRSLSSAPCLLSKGGFIIHTLIKIVNNRYIRYWSLGDVYYITDDNGKWVCEHKQLKEVEDWARNN